MRAPTLFPLTVMPITGPAIISSAWFSTCSMDVAAAVRAIERRARREMGIVVTVEQPVPGRVGFHVSENVRPGARRSVTAMRGDAVAAKMLSARSSPRLSTFEVEAMQMHGVDRGAGVDQPEADGVADLVAETLGVWP